MPGDSSTAGRRLRSRRAAATERRFIKPHDSKPSVSQERWRLIVNGKVQGVGFRASCCNRAKDLGLSGWVRNRSDGCVEVEAEGSIQDLTELRLWCETGPSGTNTNGVAVTQIAPTGSDWFEVRR